MKGFFSIAEIMNNELHTAPDCTNNELHTAPGPAITKKLGVLKIRAEEHQLIGNAES